MNVYDRGDRGQRLLDIYQQRTDIYDTEKAVVSLVTDLLHCLDLWYGSNVATITSAALAQFVDDGGEVEI